MNFLYKLYFLLPNFAFLGIVGKIINRVLAIILKRIFDLTVPSYLKRTSNKADYGLNTIDREETYIVSLTSFPARINYIWITIEILLRQSFKPDKIILWLAEEQFPDKLLPKSLIELTKRGLEIEYCSDLKSHKKYFFVMRKYPDANIITFDDDLYYDNQVIKNVVDLHKRFPDYIVTNRAHKITFNKNGDIEYYKRWKHNVVDKLPSKLLFPTGGAGTLYPPFSLPSDAFNEQKLKELCYQADDVWLKIMGYLNNLFGAMVYL